MSRKSPSFGQLLAYMTIPERVGPAIAHNLTSDPADMAAMHREFLDNFRYLPKRKNGNVLYHEVLSFSDRDQPNVTPSIVEDLTRKYLDLRAPYALAYAQAHFQETECPHVHIMISANKIASHRRLSLSRAEFAKVKRDLEQYQRDRYPFLEHSVVFERGRSGRQYASVQNRQSRNESERDRRLARQGSSTDPSQKEVVRKLVAQQLEVATSPKAFYFRLKTLGLLFYRRGQHVGVLDLPGRPASLARRYRLETLGLADDFQKALDRWKVERERLMVLEEQELEHEQQRWDQLGYRDQIRDVLALHRSELSPLERERLEQIRVVRAFSQDKEHDPPERSL